MSAYEDAREKAWDAIAELLREWNEIGSDPMAEHPVIYDVGKIGRYVESPLFHAAVDTFLAALPPSIVVDGQVVELTVETGFTDEESYATWALAAVHQNKTGRLRALLDAAREVARGEGQ